MFGFNKPKPTNPWGPNLRLAEKTLRNGTISYVAQKVRYTPHCTFWASEYASESCCEVVEWLDKKYGEQLLTCDILTKCPKGAK